MKFLMYIVIFSSLLSQYAYGQKIEKPLEDKSPERSYDFYMSKKRTNQTIGWILAGTGAAAFTIGLIAETESEPENIGEAIGKEVGNELKKVFMIGGGAIAATSVPFFIMANNNKNKAELALKGGSVSFNDIRIPKSTYLALAVTIPIGD